MLNDSIWIIDTVARESMLFAATGLLIGGTDDLLVDALYLRNRLRWRNHGRMNFTDLPAKSGPDRLAVFVAAWDESRVIGTMLATALARFDHDHYLIYVGVYPNDRATIDVVAALAERDARIRMVIGTANGPTTKADNLNHLWSAALADETRDQCRLKAVILHDAEDVVHPLELRVFDALIETHDVVQLPVLPLVKMGSRLVSGHYADEFAEHHTAQLPIRTALGAAMPLAGTGCAIARDMLAAIAAERGGLPFDETSLTEDYELGLRIGELGGRCIFARVQHGAKLVAVRAYFPATIASATRQKARWMTGIALAGWDRTGWRKGPRQWSDHWMRMRDRRAPFAVLVLAVAYVGAMSWGMRTVLHWLAGTPPPGDRLAAWLIATTTALLGWRLAMRFACTARCYGRREAMWSVPRFFVGNLIALVAAPRALVRYVGMLRGDVLVWDKTVHEFPDAAGLDLSIA
jgi:adsorption protein B